MDIGHAADWKKYAGGWRVDTDVECSCDTLVGWENSVDDRFDDTPGWTRHAGPGGWNDLDFLDDGNGAMDGLTKAERQTYATLWAIAKSPPSTAVRTTPRTSTASTSPRPPGSDRSPPWSTRPADAAS